MLSRVKNQHVLSTPRTGSVGSGRRVNQSRLVHTALCNGMCFAVASAKSQSVNFIDARLGIAESGARAETAIGLTPIHPFCSQDVFTLNAFHEPRLQRHVQWSWLIFPAADTSHIHMMAPTGPKYVSNSHQIVIPGLGRADLIDNNRRCCNNPSSMWKTQPDGSQVCPSCKVSHCHAVSLIMTKLSPV